MVKIAMNSNNKKETCNKANINKILFNIKIVFYQGNPLKIKII
jgi:hypothetical protein